MKFIPFFTHLERELVRFFAMPNNSIIPGAASAFLNILIFGYALGARISGEGLNYLEFLIPGLMMFNLINGAYANPSWSIYMGKYLNFIQDLLVSPLSYMSLTWAYVMGGAIRGLTMAFVTWLVAIPFVFVPIHNFFMFFIYIMLTSILFSCLGILTGLWANDFEKLNMFVNFAILPLVFLGGVFYSIEYVSSFMRTITEINPVFYMINGVRYGMTGHLEASIMTGLYILIPLTMGVFLLCVHLLKIGWNLRT